VRVGRREVGMRRRRRRHARDGEGPTQGLGARARAERTVNMSCMSVTLDVSKLSGWLKARAFCRVQRGHPTHGNAWHAKMCGTEGRKNQQRTRCVCGVCVWPSSEASYDAERGVWARRRGGVWGGGGAIAECTRSGASAKRTRNIVRMFVTLDVSKLLSVWLNASASCRAKRKGCTKRSEVRAGMREGLGQWRRKRRAGRGMSA
jgi:hypothetical protein